MDFRRQLPKVVAITAAVLFLGACGLSKTDYQDSAYEPCFVWQDLEVGIINRLPLWNLAGTGRCAAVIAFPRGKPDQARVIMMTPKGELPRRPQLVSAKGSILTFRLSGLVTQCDLTAWSTFPLRSDSSSKPLGIRNPAQP